MQFNANASGNQSKKVTFEPKLLIFEGNEVSQQEKRDQSQQQLPQQISNSDLYSRNTMQDLIFMNNLPDFYNDNADKEAGQNFRNGGGSNPYQQQMISLPSTNNNSTMGFQSGKQSGINVEVKEGNIKQSKSLNDVRTVTNPLIHHSTSFNLQSQVQNQQPPQSTPAIAKNDSASSLNKLQTGGASGSNIQISNIKNNVKNTYIKKISSLMLVQDQSNQNLAGTAGTEKDGGVKQEIRESDDENDESGSKSFDNKPGDDSNDNKRLKKNRESARNSRQRKKIYIDLLEKKVSELNKEIEDVCVYIEKSQSSISSVLENNPFLRGLVQDRLGFIERIQKQINDPTPNEDELNLVCDSFRLRLGATGRIRQNAISLFFKFMYKGFFENNYQYFLYGYDSQNQDSEDDEFNRCVELFKDTVGLPENDNQIYSALPILKKFLEHRKAFKKIFKEMKGIEKDWKVKTASVENLVDKISPLLTATQVGQLIDSIDKKRQQSELSSLKRRHNQISSQVMANSLAGQFGNQTNTQTTFGIPSSTAAASASNNYFQNPLNPPIMTPSQILSANNSFAYNSQSQMMTQNISTNVTSKNTFPNSLDFQIDSLPHNSSMNNLNNLGSASNNNNLPSEDPAQNFYSQIQFSNYRMYQPLFQIPQQSSQYFGSRQGSGGQHNSNIGNNIHQSQQQQQQLGHHQQQQHNTQQPLMNDHLFPGGHQQHPQGFPFFDMLPPSQQKDDQNNISKQNIGLISNNNNNENYFIQDNAIKKRKNF